MKRREFIVRSAAAAGTLMTAKALRGQAKTPRIRVAIIGRTGKGDYGHSLDTTWNVIEQAEVVAVADEDPKGRAEAATRLKVTRTYADYRQMLGKERPQVVTVAPRWLDCHRDMVVACAETGCHVFMEKPFARTLAEADEMVAAMEKRNLKLAIAHSGRYAPAIEHAREIIAEGRIGDVVELRGRGKEDLKRGGGEDLMVLGTHIMDLMRLLAGDARSCFATVRQDGRPAIKSDIRDGNEGIGPLTGDEIEATYRFDKGVSGFFATRRSAHGANARYGVNVYGTKGMITIAMDGPQVWLCEDPTWSPGRSGAKWRQITGAVLDRPETAPANPAITPMHSVALDLLRAIGTDKQPRSSMYDGRSALEMILSVYESNRRGRPVPLPLAERRHPLTLW